MAPACLDLFAINVTSCPARLAYRKPTPALRTLLTGRSARAKKNDFVASLGLIESNIYPKKNDYVASLGLIGSNIYPQKKTTMLQVVGKSIGKKGKESLLFKLNC